MGLLRQLALATVIGVRVVAVSPMLIAHDASRDPPRDPPADTSEYAVGIPLQQEWSYRAEMLAALIEDRELPNLYFDISWKRVAADVTASESALTAAAALLNRYPDRSSFGAGALSPPGIAAYLDVCHEYAPLWKRLRPEASDKIRLENHLTLFDYARRRVRVWERANTP